MLLNGYRSRYILLTFSRKCSLTVYWSVLPDELIGCYCVQHPVCLLSALPAHPVSSRCWSRLQLRYIVRAAFLFASRHLFSYVTKKIRSGYQSAWKHLKLSREKTKHPWGQECSYFLFVSSFNDLENLICEQKSEERWPCLICYPLNCSLISAGIGRWFWWMKVPSVFNILKILKRP